MGIIASTAIFFISVLSSRQATVVVPEPFVNTPTIEVVEYKPADINPNPNEVHLPRIATQAELDVIRPREINTPIDRDAEAKALICSEPIASEKLKFAVGCDL